MDGSGKGRRGREEVVLSAGGHGLAGVDLDAATASPAVRVTDDLASLVAWERVSRVLSEGGPSRGLCAVGCIVPVRGLRLAVLLRGGIVGCMAARGSWTRLGSTQ